MHLTLQDRLVKELRLRGVDSVQHANAFMIRRIRCGVVKGDARLSRESTALMRYSGPVKLDWPTAVHAFCAALSLIAATACGSLTRTEPSLRRAAQRHLNSELGAKTLRDLRPIAHHKLQLDVSDEDPLLAEVALMLVEYGSAADPTVALAVAFREGSITEWLIAGGPDRDVPWIELSTPPHPDEGRKFVDEFFDTGDGRIVAAFVDAAVWEDAFGASPPFNYAPGLPAP